MSNPNFVSDLVAMAKAFEELPEVKRELDEAHRVAALDREAIQRLELRIIDLKNAYDQAVANTRKVEVERDHAEHMFLETDDRLNAFRRLLGSFQTEAGALIAAATVDPDVVTQDEAANIKHEAGFTIGDPGPAIGGAFEDVGQGDVGEPVISTDHTPASVDTAPISSAPVHSNSVETQGERAVDPTTGSLTQTHQADVGSGSVSGTDTTSQGEAVSVQPDPTQATESSSESGLSGSGSQGLREADPTVSALSSDSGSDVQSTGATTTENASQHTTTHLEGESVSDPTASSTAGDGHSPRTVEASITADTIADASSQEQPQIVPSIVDDVGYHNEPNIVGTGAVAWAEWDKWCERMNHRYPHSQGGWPPRTQAAQ